MVSAFQKEQFYRPYGPTRLISICLYGESGWAIDEKRSLWFTNGVGYQSPFGCTGSWMKVCFILLRLIRLKIKENKLLLL